MQTFKERTMKTFKQYITEKQSDTIVITFGRFQGIHKGHAESINEIVEEARKRNADHLIFPSVSHDNKKNPIPFEKKVEFLREIFPYANFNDDPEINQIFKILPYVSKGLGYENVILLAGEDRVEEWKGKLSKFLRGDGPIKNLEIESTGSRQEGLSGSDVREIVKQGDFDKFYDIMPDGTDRRTAEEIFETIKQNLEA